MDHVYLGKDNRLRIYDKETKKVMSYPKYLMEKEIGRKLNIKEQIHHKDRNPLNNDISNLEIRLLGEHQAEHGTKYKDKVMICQYCRKEFVWTAHQQRIFYSNKSRKNQKHYSLDNPFCSKSCAGKYGGKIRSYKKGDMAK